MPKIGVGLASTLNPAVVLLSGTLLPTLIFDIEKFNEGVATALLIVGLILASFALAASFVASVSRDAHRTALYGGVTSSNPVRSEEGMRDQLQEEKRIESQLNHKVKEQRDKIGFVVEDQQSEIRILKEENKLLRSEMDEMKSELLSTLDVASMYQKNNRV